jgi:hypothetical protein
MEVYEKKTNHLVYLSDIEETKYIYEEQVAYLQGGR